MSAARTITVAADEADVRLDRWFKRRFPEVSHGRLERLLRTGQIRVDGRRAKSGTRLVTGQAVRIPPLPEEGRVPRPAPPSTSASDAAALCRAILYADDSVMAIDKPAGLAVQGGTGQRRHLDAMLGALSLEGAGAPRLVHRLDKDTSGVLLLARTVTGARKLTAAFRRKAVRKVYWALVAGVPRERRGRINAPLAKRTGARGEKVGAGVDLGRPAVTLYRVVQERKIGARGSRVAWLVLMPLTGRTHQLRAHCAALGTPILCDGKYGGRTAFPEDLPCQPTGPIPKRLMLHAREIALPHPEDGTTLRVTAPEPPHMAAAFAELGLDLGKGERAAADLLIYAAGQAHSPPAKGTVARDRRRVPRIARQAKR